MSSNRSASIGLWLVAGLLLLTAGAFGLWALAFVPSLATLGAFALCACVLAGSIVLSLRVARRGREASARSVERIDAALRALAQRTGYSFAEGGGYSHAAVGFVPHSGSLSGAHGALRFKLFFAESEEDFALTLSVSPVPGAERRLASTSADLPPQTAALVAALESVCDRIAIESTAPASLRAQRAPSGRDFELVCRASGDVEALLAPERLRLTLENALALGLALSTR
jgi:hypothetical protein